METDSGLYPPIPLHESLRRHAREMPDKPAYIWYGREISFGELDRMSDAFAARIQALGVKKGDPVTVFMNNCPQYVIAQYGIQKAGAVCCPCSSLNKEHELFAQLDDLQARVMVASQSLLPVVNQVRERTTLEHVFVTRYGDLLPDAPALPVPDEVRVPSDVPLDGTEDFLAAASTGAKPAAVAVDMDDTAVMIYTSGSTGRSKGAMLSFRNAWFKSAASVQCCDITAKDTLLLAAPLYHIAGMVGGVNAPVLAGATAVLLYRFDARTAAQAIAHYRITSMYTVAPMNVAIMQLPDVGQFDLSSLKRNQVTSFGIDWTEALAKQWSAVTGGCISHEASYGLTESHTVDCYMPVDAIRWGTHGKPVPGNEIRILDPETGAEMPTGEQGEIVLRSPGTFKGYRNRPDATAETLRNGWIHTGDMGKLDADGYLTFMGRFKEMIKVSGYSVFPEDVESILNKHPAIQQSAIIGVPDPTKGEVVKAFLVLRPGMTLDADALTAWARENMAPYKVPREIRFMDALPATGAGKVLRRLLKDLP